MKAPLRHVLPLVLLTLIAGALGGWLGVVYGEGIARPKNDLDAMIHHDLNLTEVQKTQIEALEQRYAARRMNYETQMRTANRELADALGAEHRLGPRARSAIARFHHVEEQYEVATIKHVLAMRAVLDGRQAGRFDSAIHKALTAGPP